MMQNTESRKLHEERLAASINRLKRPATAPVDIDTLATLLHRLDCIRCRMTWCCGGISTDDQDRARDVAQWPELAAVLEKSNTDVLRPAREFYDDLADTDVESLEALDVVSLVEDLGRLLPGGAQ